MRESRVARLPVCSDAVAPVAAEISVRARADRGVSSRSSVVAARRTSSHEYGFGHPWTADPELSGRRGPDGQPDPGLRLELDPARRPRAMAREPADRGPHHADVPPADLGRLGRRADLPLQRRLSLHHRRQAPSGARPADAGGVARNLERHRAAAVDRARRRRGHLRRRAAPDHGAQRLPGGDLLHLLLQPDTGRERSARRHHLRQHRRLPTGRGRAAVAPAAGTRGQYDRCAVLAGSLRAERQGARQRPARHSLRPALREAAGRRDLVARGLCGVRRGPSRRPARSPTGRRIVVAARHSRGPQCRFLRRSRPALWAGAADGRLGQALQPGGDFPRPRQRPGLGMASHRRIKSLPAVRQHLPGISRADRRPDRRRDRQRRRLRAGATPERGPGGARPGQDRVLLQRQPRIQDPADPDARAAARSPVRRRAAGAEGSGRRGGRAPQRPQALADGEQPARLLTHGGRPGQGELCAGRSRRAQRRHRVEFPRGHRDCRAQAPDRPRASPGAGLRRPGDVGENSAQPVVERVQVHAGRRDRPVAGALSGRPKRDRHGRRHRGGDPGRGTVEVVRALPPDRRPAGALDRGIGHRAGAGQRSGEAARRNSLRSRASRGGEPPSPSRCRSAALTCQRTMSAPKRRMQPRRPSRTNISPKCRAGRRARLRRPPICSSQPPSTAPVRSPNEGVS